MDQTFNPSDLPVVAEQPSLDDVARLIDLGPATTLVDERPGELPGFGAPVMIAGRSRGVLSSAERERGSLVAVYDVFERPANRRILDALAERGPRASVVVEVSDSGDAREMSVNMTLAAFGAGHDERVVQCEAIGVEKPTARGGDVGALLVGLFDRKAEVIGAERLTIIGDSTMWDTLAAEGFEVVDPTSVAKRIFDRNVFERAIVAAEGRFDSEAPVDRAELARELNGLVLAGLPQLSGVDQAESVVVVNDRGDLVVDDRSPYSEAAVSRALVEQVGVDGLRTLTITIGEHQVLLGDALFDGGVAGVREVGESADGIETASDEVMFFESTFQVPSEVAQPKEAPTVLPIGDRIRQRASSLVERVAGLVDDVKTGRWGEWFDRKPTNAELDDMAFFAELVIERNSGEVPVVPGLSNETHAAATGPEFADLADEVLGVEIEALPPVDVVTFVEANPLPLIEGPYAPVVILAERAADLVAITNAADAADDDDDDELWRLLSGPRVDVPELELVAALAVPFSNTGEVDIVFVGTSSDDMANEIEVRWADDVQADLASYAEQLRANRGSAAVTAVRRSLGKEGLSFDEAGAWWMTPRAELGTADAPLCPAALVGTARETELFALIGWAAPEPIVDSIAEPEQPERVQPVVALADLPAVERVVDVAITPDVAVPFIVEAPERIVVVLGNGASARDSVWAPASEPEQLVVPVSDEPVYVLLDDAPSPVEQRSVEQRSVELSPIERARARLAELQARTHA